MTFLQDCGFPRSGPRRNRFCAWTEQEVAPMSSIAAEHVYEVRPRKGDHGVDLISDALPLGRLWYDTPPDHAVGYAIHSSRSHDAVIRVYDHGGQCGSKLTRRRASS